MDPKEREALEFLAFKDHQGLLGQWAHLECLENLELVNLVPPVILENLASLASLEEMVHLDQWVCKGQRVILGNQAQEHQENPVRMAPQVCLDQWE